MGSEQASVSGRIWQKLMARYYGPFRELDKIGNTSDKLDLPANKQQATATISLLTIEGSRR